jgi:hypothetical protein
MSALELRVGLGAGAPGGNGGGAGGAGGGGGSGGGSGGGGGHGWASYQGSLAGGAVDLTAFDPDEQYIPGKTTNGYAPSWARRTMIVGGWPQDTDASVILATLRAIVTKAGWNAAELEKPTVSGRFAACGKLHWINRNALMTKMVEYKGNHKIEIGDNECVAEQAAMKGSFWFDIDNPKVEREFKRKVAQALRSLRQAYIEKEHCEEAVARKKFDADYSKGTLFFREGASNRAMRFVEYKIDVVANRWLFSAPMPTTLEALVPGFDLASLVVEMNG